MTPRDRPRATSLTRADLPDELTAESLRHYNLKSLRMLQRPGNGVLTAAEQEQFDRAMGELQQQLFQYVHDAEGRARRGGPMGLDPEMRRSYQRTQERLWDQARRAREALPELADEAPVTPPDDVPPAPETSDATDTDVSADSLTEELEETSTILELLDRIAGIEQQQLEHQESQRLLDTRGFFFAFLVSVAVIVAGVAPLVEADPHERVLIAVWTIVACGLAALVYAGVRATQRKD